MSISVENNVIKIPIEILPEDLTKWREIWQQAQEIKEVANKIGSVGVEEPGKVVSEGTLDDFKEDPFFKQPAGGPNLLKLAATGAQGPGGVQSLIEAQFMEMIPFLGEVMIASGIAKKMFDWYFSPGAPGDIRFKRDIPLEQEKFLSREEQQARRIGLKQVIITSQSGFSNLNGAGMTNTLDQIRRISSGQPGMGGMMGIAKDIGLDDKAKGWVP